MCVHVRIVFVRRREDWAQRLVAHVTSDAWLDGLSQTLENARRNQSAEGAHVEPENDVERIVTEEVNCLMIKLHLLNPKAVFFAFEKMRIGAPLRANYSIFSH